MVEAEIRIPKEGLIKTLDEGYDAAKKVDTDVTYLWSFGDKAMKIQEDYFIADLDEYGWITINPTEFTSEMLEMILEVNPELATGGLLEIFLVARAANREKKE